MNLKSKIFGTLAASAIALSMMGGVASAQSSDSVIGAAQLKEGICKVDITQSETWFGTWVYDGDSYELADGSNNVSVIGATLTAAEPGGTCSGNISLGSGLEGPGGFISPNNFSIEAFGYSGRLPDSGSVPFNSQAPDSVQGVTLELEEVDEDYAPGEYSGTIVFVTVSAD